MTKLPLQWRLTLILLNIFMLSASYIFAQQDTIRLDNPSFEGFPTASNSPQGWYDCGRINFPNETPPDVHPNMGQPMFGVITAAQDGITYLGMVVRDNDTWESVSQRLDAPMVGGECYSFSLYLARSGDYLSAIGSRISDSRPGRDPNQLINHNTPASLRIWGGNGYCDKGELLASTSEIPHERWIEYQYKFEPTRRITYITLEVFYKTPTPFPYNGNLLIDNLSAIALTPCQEEAPIVEFSNPKSTNKKVSKASFTFRAKAQNVKNQDDLTVIFNNNLVEEFYFDSRTGGIAVPERLRKGRNTLIIKAKNSTGKVDARRSVTFEEKEEEVIIVSKPEPRLEPTPSKPRPPIIERSDLVEGKTIRIEKLYFPADSTNIKVESYPALDQIYDFLNSNPDVVVEIGGHTNGVPPPEYCFRLSSERAKAVAVYLVKKGISTERLRYKGYGKTKQIATNKTKEGRLKNQRVEIMILSFKS